MTCRYVRLWLATKLLGFMRPGTALVLAERSCGTIEWDGGQLVSGTRIVPIGLVGLVVDEDQ
jgi:hypothetical protein